MGQKVVSILAVLVCLGFLYFKFSEDSKVKPLPAEMVTPVRSVAPLPETLARRKMPGENILRGYGSESQSAEKDIEQVREMVANLMMLVKDRDPREYATNEDLADFLRGKNRYRQAMLPPEHAAFDREGRLVDRNGNPIVVHVVSKDEVEIFGAGEDGIPWTEDDVGRRER